MKFKILIVGLAIAATFGASGQAQETTCEERGTNGMVTLLLCPPGLDLEAMQEAGIAACGDRKPCGAWIWDDAAHVPDEAPDAHDKLPKESILLAKAIWVNEKHQLITLEKVED